ncbi:YggS family pyridoxal phosphate-dependent enzyme [Paenibacillus eucommiae]|uniref:Pyridoxal phosphate homeostasis protein n=1 Tax=Paenibacillus eucommiae TaxID=1355755 RepID=A0ABS4J5J4_9BACL|nr:YggS family pyridoxal phosphate-dependent enzyme [Paenibacillus eucommiae]MBP1995121.1 pyridoxal phosphate enzyme (YggS family) [Paenibacillus eucommiae]
MDTHTEEAKDTKDVQDNLKDVRNRIQLACEASGRKAKEIRLLLATKTVPDTKISAAIQAGETLLGENKVQELQHKYPRLRQHSHIEWHFIGHLQTNKVKEVLKYATMIHSVDRLKLGQALHNQLTKENNKMDILVQVNTSYEESKFGVSPEDTLALIESLSIFETLNIKGLMTIGKLNAKQEETRNCFRLLKKVQKQVIERGLPGVTMNILSMGMSGDFEVAIEEGATMIRVGSSIFGERMYPDHYYWNEHSAR